MRAADDIFHDAREIKGPSKRAAYLDTACAGDAELRAKVDELLRADAELGGFLASRASGQTTLDPVPLSERAGSRIGPYKLLQPIGEGGFGTVFLAEQSEPVRRKVALKIIKLGMDSRQVVARFEAERQALAVMNHPHIARVFDGGMTDSGRPYFVMEYVVGDAITPFCDAHKLSVHERLDLFQQVCAAVQHAHTKGIIHRDLKPANVLVSMVDGKPFAKVIDFGIAKATATPLTDKTLFTEHRQLIGTPEYMSPEQAEGSPDIDTRTDVYALGVLLYELLTGLTPFDAKRLRSAAYAEMQRIIREEDPPAPSLRLARSLGTLATAAATRGVEPGKLSTLVKGELDWIVMKALDKDRARRYETAVALAADVQRHLSGEAVVAAPPSAGYRVKKFVRRNKGAVLTIGSIAAVVLAAGITVIAFARSAVHASVREAEQAAIATANAQEARKQAALAEASAAEASRQAGMLLDAAAFAACATYDPYEDELEFLQPPTAAALRHMPHVAAIRAITELTVTGSVTDEGVKALAAADTGLTNLTMLNLSSSSVTDEGVKALAAADTGLKNLTTLTLNTSVTAEGLKALAAADTGLKNLTTLKLIGNSVTAEDLKALAAADTGLTNLTTLELRYSSVTDEGLKALAAADTGLKNLTTLNLNTSVTAEGLKALAAADTGLTNLTTLNLYGTPVTAEGLKALAAADTGLTNLTTLTLSGKSLTAEGLKALAADTGLKNLTTLKLRSTSVTAEGLKALAAADTGLTNLTTLDLSYTHVTDEGLKALAAADTGLTNLTTLNLWGTPVTAEGLKALAAADTGLKNLTTLGLSQTYFTNGTPVTAEGLAAVKARWPGIKIER